MAEALCEELFLSNLLSMEGAKNEYFCQKVKVQKCCPHPHIINQMSTYGLVYCKIKERVIYKARLGTSWMCVPDLTSSVPELWIHRNPDVDKISNKDE